MKKTLYGAIILSLMSTFSFAQVRFGVKGSLQFANLKVKDASGTTTGNNLLGFQAGLLLDAPLTENISLRPQILYSVKGTKQEATALGSTISTKLVFNYVEVPVQLAYGIQTGPGRIVLGVGPYVSYALNGKATVGVNGDTQTANAEFGSGQNQVKRLDFGLHLSAGYELTSGLMLSGYYSPGLTNLSNNSSDGTIKNTAYGISLGFLFGGE